MKPNVGRGGGFGGALEYAMDSKKDPELVGGNMTGRTAKDLKSEFAISRQMRPGCKRPVWHTSLSLPAGETLTNEQWDRLTADFMDRMGLDPSNHQYTVVRHRDTDYDHVHIVASRIGLDGNLWYGQWEARKAINTCQVMERDYGLTLTPGLESENRSLTKGEIEKSIRTGEPAPRVVIEKAVQAASSEPVGIFDFMDNLESQGITAIPNVQSTGRMNGFSFEYQGLKFSGSKIGKKYKWTNLQKQVSYEQSTESAELLRRAEQIQSRRDLEQSGEDRQLGASADRSDRSIGEDHAEAAEQAASSGPAVHGDTGERVESGSEVDRGNVGGPRAEAALEAGIRRIAAERGEADKVGIPSEVQRGVDQRSSAWSSNHDRAHSVAARAGVSAGESAGIARANQVKERAWNQQQKALKADAYRVTAVNRETGKTFVFKDQASESEIKNSIGKLSGLNAKGHDIYITPQSRDKQYIVVDDLTKDSLKKMRDSGCNPNLVQKSSDNNYQAVFAVQSSGQSPEAERQAATRITRQLNKKFGDPNFSGTNHPFRMGGFNNKKPERNNEFTTISSTSEKETGRVQNAFEIWSKEAEVEIQDKQEQKQNIDKFQEPWKINGIHKDQAVKSYVSEMSSISAGVDKSNMEKDWSAVDYRACVESFKKDPRLLECKEEMKEAIKNHSPDINDRKNSPEDYAERTVEKAAKDPKVEKALSEFQENEIKQMEKQKQRDQDQGLEM